MFSISKERYGKCLAASRTECGSLCWDDDLDAARKGLSDGKCLGGLDGERHNQRRAEKKLLGQRDNDFGRHYLPKPLLRQNTVFLLLTAMLRNFFRLLLRNEALHVFGIWCTYADYGQDKHLRGQQRHSRFYLRILGSNREM